MCFSAVASFTAAGVLGAAGAATLKQAKTKAEKPFAAIPLFFAAQQAIEGVVWLTFGTPRIQAGAAHLYLLFSHVFWPAFLPYAVWKLETGPRRKDALRYFVFLGSMIGAYLLFYVLMGPASVTISGHGLVYEVPLPSVPFSIVPYVLATCVPLFISSHKYVRVMGMAVSASLLITYWYYLQAFYSVWCFFAAILSLIIYVHLRYASVLSDLKSAVKTVKEKMV
jgi:hypothetical protein